MWYFVGCIEVVGPSYLVPSQPTNNSVRYWLMVLMLVGDCCCLQLCIYVQKNIRVNVSPSHCDLDLGTSPRKSALSLSDSERSLNSHIYLPDGALANLTFYTFVLLSQCNHHQFHFQAMF
jgi:hypothetical protein